MTDPVDFTACPRVPRIDPAAFARLVAETPYLTDLQREFYTACFAARAEKLFHVHPRN